MPFRRDRSKLHALECTPKSFHTSVLLLASPIQLHEGTQEDQTPDRPLKRVKFFSPVSSPNQLQSKTKSRTPSSTPVTPLVPIHNSQSQHRLSSFPALDTYQNSSVLLHGSTSDLSTATHFQPFDPSVELTARSGPKKPLKALASFLGSFLETARNATHMQAETSSRSSVKRKRTTSVRLTNADSTSHVPIITHESVVEGHRRTFSAPRLQPLGSMRSFIETSIRNPSSLVGEVAHQLPLPAGPVLRTLTARSHLLLKSVKSQTTAASVSPSVANLLSHLRPDPRAAAYVNQLLVGQVAESQPVSLNAPSNVSDRYLRQPAVLSSYTVLSGPQQILAALQPPIAQIVLSSTPELFSSPFPQLSDHL